ncbi:MAG: DNA-processing protein DprA [Betaproteobacteria bacterium]|nr:DNA-processing protein DprA [Betaproteobacteria bacterium]
MTGAVLAAVERDSDLAAWIRLTLVPGLGGQGLRKLLAAHGLPQHVLAAGRRALAAQVGEDLADRIHEIPDRDLLERTFEWLAQPRHSIVTLADSNYPPQLLEIPDPPALLYVCGDASLLAQRSLAMVGSRNATPQGLANAESFARHFSNAGFPIVSGLALGIDAAAHRGALAGRSSTVAVLGTGIDVIYPPRNAQLAEEIATRGVMVTEFPIGAPPVRENFPRRNRIISGLARGVLVVEAAISSGSLITARMAVDQGRDVYAVPGSIHSPLAKGCHALIKQGAKLVESAEDVLSELGVVGASDATHLAPGVTDVPVLEHMGYDPCNVDTLCERSGLTPDKVSAILLQLELEGRVMSLPGGVYQRVS